MSINAEQSGTVNKPHWFEICSNSFWYLIKVMCLIVAIHSVTYAQSQTELNLQAKAKYDHAESERKQVFRALSARLSEGYLNLLQDSDDIWISYRDVECRFETGGFSGGGSAQPMAELDCRTNVTHERTKRLRQLLTCQEGDLSCPLTRR